MPKQFLIKNATLIQEGHPRHSKSSDLLISDGIIVQIASNISADAAVIEGKDLMVSKGWHDMRVHLNDPGYEHKESIAQLCAAAAAGGFTSLSTLPDALPVIDNKSGVQYLLNATEKELVDLKPFGALSEQLHGKDLAELYDLHQHGAVAFTDGERSVRSGLLKKALLYVQSFDGLVISSPLDASLHHDGQVNESDTTVATGLKASPALAEYSCVRQQLDILEYTGGRLHLSGISAAESVRLIKEAKKKGLDVTADVCILNLCFTDASLGNFDSNFKLMPLLRTEKDRKALIKGVQDGTIDVVVSNHKPQNVELKKVEFDYAESGAIGIQTVYNLYNEHLRDQMDEATFIKAISSNPRRVLKLDQTELQEGAAANLTVVDRAASWTLNAGTNRSQSYNSHLWGQDLTGKVLAVFNGKKHMLC